MWYHCKGHCKNTPVRATDVWHEHTGRELNNITRSSETITWKSGWIPVEWDQECVRTVLKQLCNFDGLVSLLHLPISSCLLLEHGNYAIYLYMDWLNRSLCKSSNDNLSIKADNFNQQFIDMALWIFFSFTLGRNKII